MDSSDGSIFNDIKSKLFIERCRYIIKCDSRQIRLYRISCEDRGSQRMKKRLNILFFSICFLGAILAEAYFLQAGAEKLFSVIAIGIVVLITGYLLMDSIRSKLMDSGRGIKNYLDQMYREDSERFIENMEELKNLQKATYTATKKNSVMLSHQFEELLDRVETLENNNTKSLQKLLELQKKALEGQKNALNLEINYNKENTKLIIKALKEAGNQEETKELLNKLLEQLEKGTAVLQNELQNISITIQGPLTNNLYSEHEWELGTETRVENLTETGWDIDAEIEVEDSSTSWMDSSDDTTEKEAVEIEWEAEQQDEITQAQEETLEWKGDVDLELNNLISSWENEPTIEIAPEITAAIDTEQVPEAMEVSSIEVNVEPVETEDTAALKIDEEGNEIGEEITPEFKPIYDDPNKALSADEIAALFASFGQ